MSQSDKLSIHDIRLSKAIMKAGDLAKQVLRDQSNWLEDVLAGLLINGVAKEDIHINHYLESNDVVVTVKGVPKYRWSLRIGKSNVQDD